MFKIILQIYYSCGGLRFMLATPYLYSALILSLTLADPTQQTDWAQLATGMFPSILGFSLATFAIVLAILGEARLTKLAARKDDGPSLLAKLTALVVHTSIVQSTALIIAFSLKQNGFLSNETNHRIVKSLQCLPYTDWVYNAAYYSGLFLTFYGLILVISTLLAVYQIALLIK